jgi:hypothetical protein
MFNGPIFNSPIYTLSNNTDAATTAVAIGVSSASGVGSKISSASGTAHGIASTMVYSFGNKLSINIGIHSNVNADLTRVCIGLKCKNKKNNCAKWRLKYAQTGNSRAYIPVITVCDQNLDYREWDIYKD